MSQDSKKEDSKAALAACAFHCAPALLPQRTVTRSPQAIALVRDTATEHALPGEIIDVATPPPRA